MIPANGVAARTQKLKVNTTEGLEKADSNRGVGGGGGGIATGTLFKVGIAEAISNPSKGQNTLTRLQT